MKMHHEPIWLWPSENDVVFWNRHSLDPDYFEMSDSSGFGSCTLSLAAGYYFGSSKWAQTYIVKIPSAAKYPKSRVVPSLSSWVASASVVYNQMKRARDEQQTRPTVVLFPRTFNVWGEDLDPGYQRSVKGCLQLLFEMGAVVITSIGRPKVSEVRRPATCVKTAFVMADIDYIQILEDGSLAVQWPAAAKKWFGQLIIVGSVYNFGQMYQSSRGAIESVIGQARLSTVVDVWAPGDSLTCATGEGSGTSQQSGSVYSAAV